MIKIKNKKLRFVITFLAVLLSALLQTFVIESFVQTAGLLSGGFTGVAILIDRVAALFGGAISTSAGGIPLLSQHQSALYAFFLPSGHTDQLVSKNPDLPGNF